MRFSLRQLQIFTMISQVGSVTQAADRLAMSQSAASTALGEFEKQLGRQVFDRIGKRLQLNEIGRGLIPKALEMLDRADEFEGLLSKAGAPGHLHIGASRTIGNYLAPQLIEQYIRLYPGAGVKFDIGNTSRIAAHVADFNLDLALIEGQINDPSLTVADWLEDDLAIFCGPHHPLSKERHASIERILDECWIVREPGSGTRQTLDRALIKWWPRWKIALELEYTEAIKGMVAAGKFIGCLSRRALQDSFDSGKLTEIKVPELNMDRRFYIVINRLKYRTPGIDAFLNICQKALDANFGKS